KRKVFALEPVLRGLSTSCGCAGAEGQRRRAEEHYANEPTLPDRLWAKINKNGPVPANRPELGPCWLYLGGLSRDGYGSWWKEGKNRPVHVSVYVALVGPIPEGLQPDHLCRNRPCCNPAHLEPVTCQENLLRGE